MVTDFFAPHIIEHGSIDEAYPIEVNLFFVFCLVGKKNAFFFLGSSIVCCFKVLW